MIWRENKVTRWRSTDCWSTYRDENRNESRKLSCAACANLLDERENGCRSSVNFSKLVITLLQAIHSWLAGSSTAGEAREFVSEVKFYYEEKCRRGRVIATYCNRRHRFPNVRPGLMCSWVSSATAPSNCFWRFKLKSLGTSHETFKRKTDWLRQW